MASVTFAGVGTLAPAGPTRTADFAAVDFTGTGSLVPAAPFRIRDNGHRWRVVGVDLDGTLSVEFPDARIGPITWELNKWETVSVTFGKGSAGDAVYPYLREVQVWLDDQLLMVGPIVRPAASEKGTVVGDVKGPLWYFSRRNIGRAGRENYVVNGDFEEGPGGWNIGYYSPVEPVANRTFDNFEWRIARLRAMTGRRSLYLELPSASSTEFGISATQFFSATVDPSNRDGDAWTLVAYCYIPSADWIEPNPLGLGMRLGRFSTTETVLLEAPGGSPIAYPAPIETVEVALDEDTPRDTWVRMEATFVAPVTGQAELIQVDLLSPIGSIYWDRANLVQDEALRFYETDQAEIAGDIVEHLQDPAFGKSDLGIGRNTPATGILRDRLYRFSEHPPGFDALDEFPGLLDGFDHSIEVTPTSKTYTTHYPRKGRFVERASLEWGKNIASWAWALDGETAANSVVALGQGDGPDREEGQAIDLGAYGSDLVLETMVVAPPNSPIDALDDIAAEMLATTTYPEILTVKTHRHPTKLLGVVWPGDFVRVKIETDVVFVNKIFRIVRMVLDPDTLAIDFTLHERHDDYVDSLYGEGPPGL